MKRKINIRKRVVTATVLCTFFFFIITTPILTWAGDVLFGPYEVENIEIFQVENGIEISWDKNNEAGISKYIINVNGVEDHVVSNVSRLVVDSSELKPENALTIRAQNILGRQSKETTMSVSYPIANVGADQKIEISSNAVETNNVLAYLLLRIPLLLFPLLVLTFWLLQFDIRNSKVLTIGLYPAIVSMPIVLLLLSILFGDETKTTSMFFSIVSSIVFYFFLYFILLTVNILNNSLQYELPLEQAAKASQFVFSLISSYVLFILTFSSEVTLFQKIFFLVPFLFYLSFASIVFLKHISVRSALMRSLCIVLAMISAASVLSTWPLNSIYIILTLAVIFYILLSISLEVRETITRYVFIEYSVLVALISIILVINSDWGIIGSII